MATDAKRKHRGKLEREKVTVTADYVASVAARITDRDYQILQLLADCRIATTSQIALLGFNGSQAMANKRIRILYDLHMIDRHYPYVASGSSEQHIVLDSAGAKLLELSDWRKITHLTPLYRHTVATTEFRVRAYMAGWGWGELERNLGPIRSDIWYDDGTCVEIDTGTESISALMRKANKYNQIEVPTLLFVTLGNRDRAERFLGAVTTARYRKGSTIENIAKLIEQTKRAEA